MIVRFRRWTQNGWYHDNIPDAIWDCPNCRVVRRTWHYGGGGTWDGGGDLYIEVCDEHLHLIREERYYCDRHQGHVWWEIDSSHGATCPWCGQPATGTYFYYKYPVPEEVLRPQDYAREGTFKIEEMPQKSTGHVFEVLEGAV